MWLREVYGWCLVSPCVVAVCSCCVVLGCISPPVVKVTLTNAKALSVSELDISCFRLDTPATFRHGSHCHRCQGLDQAGVVCSSERGEIKLWILYRGEVTSQASNCCSSRVDICVQIFFIGKHIYNMQFCILLQLNISLFKHFVWNTTFNFQHSKLQQSDIRNAVNLTITFE